jgi:hypothetical protein
VSPQNSIDYYNSVLAKMGPDQADWLRLFMVPGMQHCGGGPGPNQFAALSAMEEWREEAVAPDQMIAYREPRMRRAGQLLRSIDVSKRTSRLVPSARDPLSRNWSAVRRPGEGIAQRGSVNSTERPFILPIVPELQRSSASNLQAKYEPARPADLRYWRLRDR